MKQFSLKSQQGASITTIILVIIALGLLARLGTAVVPAYISDYQFTKLVARELKTANEAKQTESELLKTLEQQLNINGDYKSKPQEMLVFTSKTPGALAVKTQYEVESNFYNQTFIVNRFEKEITAADSK